MLHRRQLNTHRYKYIYIYIYKRKKKKNSYICYISDTCLLALFICCRYTRLLVIVMFWFKSMSFGDCLFCHLNSLQKACVTFCLDWITYCVTIYYVYTVISCEMFSEAPSEFFFSNNYICSFIFPFLTGCGICH
jgi:hypothetical protein